MSEAGQATDCARVEPTDHTVAMRLGDIANEQPADQPRPLDGVRVLAAEQMAALPYATQLLARLGAEVVKVEHPTMGDSGRGSVPFIEDPDGRKVGATFLRNNFSKRSVALDLKAPEGVELFLDLATRFDRIEFMFLISTLTPNSSWPTGRILIFASQRICPFSMSQSEMSP